MFKDIAENEITAEEIKNRLLAYASIQAAEEEVDDDYWYGNISTYTLNLRLSGIYGEKQFNDVLSSGADSTLNIGKYPYLENEVFLRETRHLDDLNFVKQLYQAFLAREADAGGLEGNVNQLKNGALRENLVIGLRNSQEADGVFLRVTECLDDEHFLEIAHRVYLKPDNHQVRWLQDLQSLQNGLSRATVFQELKQFQQLQTALQHREGDFYRSDSVFLQNTQNFSNEEFVKELYLTYCKREADPGGLASNVEQLDNGVARSDLLFGLRTSEEAANVFVDLTAGLDNATYIAVAYLAYRQQGLTLQAKQQCLEVLEAGNIRQAILRDRFSAPTLEEPVVEPIEPATTVKPEVTPSPLELVIEQLQFSFAQEDDLFLLQTENLSNEDFIKQLYLTYLGREADPDGLAGNLQQLTNGVSRHEILYGIRTSQEAANVFVDLTASLDNASFIDLAYLNFRKQKLDPLIEAQALETLESGQIRQTILQNCPPLVLAVSVEEVTSSIIDSEKLSSTPLQQILEDLKIADQELIAQTKNLSNQEFIQHIYRIFLRREADPDGLSSHTEQLDRDISRWEILYDLRTSQEAANVFVEITTELDNSQFLDVAYTVYLQRELDPENKEAYLEYLDRDNSRQDILS
ncbi:conserved hypothetical protein [Hyella patelloides LEGE 07179]|uniref:DUF4214 domain-containing protein n=1 Tax=Hyella patelloides LEGE 07179 TaxID=945734 RepID=A0A563W3P8_9CYAN|nr:DUF4214 domain-containing protein [Hyella patelloides]VEP18319.1 conserved hypothetical protein [Hyella patelloides LEGE 07179]